MPYVNDKKPDLNILEKYKEFHLAHQYNPIIKRWDFKGYSCAKCGRIVQNPNIVPKHSMNCKKPGPTIYLQEPEPEQIINVRGEPWTPYTVKSQKR